MYQDLTNLKELSRFSDTSERLSQPLPILILLIGSKSMRDPLSIPLMTEQSEISSASVELPLFFSTLPKPVRLLELLTVMLPLLLELKTENQSSSPRSPYLFFHLG
jgi:hypothetical protein